MSFIKNANAYLNIDQAATAEVKHGRNGAGALVFKDAAGREIGIIGGAQELDVERLTAPLVPSHAVVIAVTPTGDVTAHPVAAYRVLRGGAEPVYAVTPPEGSTRFMLAGASGLVRLDDGSIYPNIEQAKAAATGMQPDQAESVVVDMPKGGRRR